MVRNSYHTGIDRWDKLIPAERLKELEQDGSQLATRVTVFDRKLNQPIAQFTYTTILDGVKAFCGMQDQVTRGQSAICGPDDKFTSALIDFGVPVTIHLEYVRLENPSS